MGIVRVKLGGGGTGAAQRCNQKPTFDNCRQVPASSLKAQRKREGRISCQRWLGGPGVSAVVVVVVVVGGPVGVLLAMTENRGVCEREKRSNSNDPERGLKNSFFFFFFFSNITKYQV